MQSKAVVRAQRIRRVFPLFFAVLSLPLFGFAQTNSSDQLFDPVGFFKRHLSPYEPIYFVAGSESPNVKFQFGFKYQLLVGEETNWWSGFHAAYTQTSLWDLNAPSAPFFDSSYKPEMFYLWRNALGGKVEDDFRLDVQFGVQHESNGKSDPDSRSLNIAYLRPSLTLGRADGWQFTLQPRFWSYLGDLSNNPDIDEYRGYVDLRATVAWRKLQLSALGRIGKSGENHSVQVDLTYQVPYTSLYLDVQYFTGYGESLLRYSQRSDVVRVGIALYR